MQYSKAWMSEEGRGGDSVCDPDLGCSSCQIILKSNDTILNIRML